MMSFLAQDVYFTRPHPATAYEKQNFRPHAQGSVSYVVHLQIAVNVRIVQTHAIAQKATMPPNATGICMKNRLGAILTTNDQTAKSSLVDELSRKCFCGNYLRKRRFV
jgi:hypothetical protein